MGYSPRLHVVLHQPEIPPNTGAVGRTCVALQAKLWLVRPLGFRTDTKTLRRAGLDYWKFLEWEIADDWEALRERLSGQRFWYFTKRAERSYLDVKFDVGDVLVFGSETSGLPDAMVNEVGDHALQIPMGPNVRSINLSCSVAITGYEAYRQFVSDGRIDEG